MLISPMGTEQNVCEIGGKTKGVVIKQVPFMSPISDVYACKQLTCALNEDVYRPPVFLITASVSYAPVSERLPSCKGTRGTMTAGTGWAPGEITRRWKPSNHLAC